MNRKRSFVYLVILLATGGLSMAFGGMPVYAEKAEANIREDMDAYLQSCAEKAHLPGLSVTVVTKDEVLFSESYGDCENERTPFLLGSVSKSFTAVCIMQLAEQGKIDPEAYISVYLPEATDGGRIRVSQLLNHTSGLGEHQTLENYKIINEQGMHHYANVNYSLLGEIIERVSGKPYHEYVAENVFKPLQLSHTAATLNESIQNGLIDGYTNYGGIMVKRRHNYSSSKNAWITVPAGYLSSSLEDLGKYLQMYLNGGNGILSEQSIDAMFYGDTVYVEGDIPFWYGYGWATVKEPLSEPVLRHSGLVETGTSCIFILPERGIGIAVAANMNDYFVANHMMDELGWGLVLMLLGNSPNEMADGTYIFNHLGIDLILLAILVIGVLPLCLFPGHIKRIKKGKCPRRRGIRAILYLILSGFILCLVPIFFKTPLWVARDFVPDVFAVVMTASAGLLISALGESFLLFRYWKRVPK